MERLKEKRDDRDWNQWHVMQEALNQAYREEELFWSKKKNQCLQEGDKNTNFFMQVPYNGGK